MGIDHITIEGVKLRHRVDTLVSSNLEEAYDIALSIKHPWYKCQALSKVAEFSSLTSMSKILKQSFDSAMNCHDENRRVSVACWPIKVAINNNLLNLANVFVNDCIQQINHDMDPISKWCAVSLLHAIKSQPILLNSYFETFKNATSKGHGWRVVRSIKYLLADKDIQQDARYIEYLTARLDSIKNWQKDHAKKFS